MNGHEDDRRRLEAICNNASVALFIMNEHQQCIYMNPAAVALTGFTLEEVRGRPLHDVIHHTRPDGSHYPLEECPIDRAFPQNNQQRGEEIFVHKDGHFYPVAFTASPIRASGADSAIVGTIIEVQDITERKRAEEELRRTNAELEQFIYVAAHDLQEPLRTILLSIDLAMQKADDIHPDLRRHAERIRANAQRMQRLISDLLIYSRVIHHEGPESARANLDQALDAALDLLQDRVDESRAIIERAPLPVVHGQESQIALVFQNLISNALKYCRRPHGTPQPRIRIRAELQGNEWVISVRDNGIGFDPAYAEKIFGLFKRLHNDEASGTGLGLAICRRIVERYHGRMWAESAGEGAGSGATFFFALPDAESWHA